MFKIRYGIMIACDVEDISTLKHLVKSTSSLDFIVGYKVGASLAIQYGLKEIINTFKQITTMPVVYDHQKYGTDIPEMCADSILNVIHVSNVDGLIIFPQAGIETLTKTVKSCFEKGIIPIVGGEMTHKGYLTKEGGYIANDAPQRIYNDAITLGVKHFIVPGTKPDIIEKYKNMIEDKISDPIFFFPGVGKGQGGDIKAAFEAVNPHSAYAIVGRGIYKEANPREAAINLWKKLDLKG